VQQRELIDAALTVTELSEVGVSVQIQVGDRLADQP